MISSGTGAVTEDTSPTATGTLTATDADNAALAFVASTQAGAYGSLTLNAAGAWNYTLGAAAQALAGGQVVTETFTVNLNDGSTTTVTITVTGTDDAPVISSGTGAVTEDTSPTATGTLTATDADNAALAFVASTQAGAYGSLTLNAAGAWNYTLGAAAQALAGGQVVTETFTVNLNDGSTTTVAITVTGTNDAPVVSSASINAIEAGAAVALGLTAPTDVDATNVLTITVTGLPAVGQVQLADGTPVANGATLTAAQLAGLRYLPPADYDGAAAVGDFTYSVNDGTVSVAGSASITLAAVNDAPVNTVPPAQTTNEDTSLAITGLAVADVDAGAGSMTVTLAVTNGTLTVTGGTASIANSGTATVTLTGTAAQINATLAANVTYVPTANFNGAASLTMTTSDNGNTGSGGTLTDTDSVSITVAAVDDAPTTSGGTVAASEDTTRLFAWADFNVSDVDTTASGLSIRIASLPSDGTLQFFNGTAWVVAAVNQTLTKANIDSGLLRFVPDANESGVDGYGAGVGNVQGDYAQFAFTVSDGVNTSAGATMRIDVTPVADGTTISAAANTPPASTGLTLTRHDNLPTLNATQAQTLANIEPAVEADAIAATSVITGISGNSSAAGSVGALGSDDAYRVSGFIYLQAGQTYTFSGDYADTLTLEIGGRRIAGFASDGSNSDTETFSGANFVPSVSGFYSLELITYNAGGSAGFANVSVAVNGGAVQALTTANFNLYATAANVTATGTVGSFVSATDTNTGGTAALSVAGYYQQRGGAAVQGQGVLLNTLSATFGDSADNSERHTVTLDLAAAPVGTRVFVDANSDGVPDDGRIFTTSAGNTSVLVFDEDNPSAAVGGANWNLAAIVVDPPAGYVGGFTVNAIARADEVVGASVVSTSSTTQALTVTLVAATNIAPDVASASASVSEEGLAGGLADSTGTVDTTDSATVSGTVSITDTVDAVADSITSVTLLAPSAALTSGGVAVTWSGTGTGTLTATAGGNPVATLTINTAGAYTFTLQGPIDHAGAGVEDVHSLLFGVVASDGVNNGIGSLTINVEDDQPTVLAPISNFIAGTDTNLLITLDISGSMGNASGIPGLTRFQAAIQSINTLLDRYDEFGAVAVRLVTFSDTAQAVARDLAVGGCGQGSSRGAGARHHHRLQRRDRRGADRLCHHHRAPGRRAERRVFPFRRRADRGRPAHRGPGGDLDQLPQRQPDPLLRHRHGCRRAASADGSDRLQWPKQREHHGGRRGRIRRP